MLMEKRDMGYTRIATWQLVGGRAASSVYPPLEGEGRRERSERRGGVMFRGKLPPPPPRRPSPPGEGGTERAARAGLIRHRHPFVVDQAVERLLHIDIGLDHAGLLQRDAGLQDRVALLGADLVVGDGGAFLQLLVGDRVGELGRRLEE